MSGWGTLPLPSIENSKSVDELLVEATVRSVNVYGITVLVGRRIGMFEQVLCEVVMYLLPDCIMGMDTGSDWRIFSLSNIVKHGMYMVHVHSPFKQRELDMLSRINRMGKTRDLFKKIRYNKGTFNAKMGTIKTKMVWT